MDLAFLRNLFEQILAATSLEQAAQRLSHCLCSQRHTLRSAVFLTDYAGEKLVLTGQSPESSMNQATLHKPGAIASSLGGVRKNNTSLADYPSAATNHGGCSTIPVDRLDDPLCFCLYSKKKLYFSPVWDQVPLSLQEILPPDAGCTVDCSFTPLNAPGGSLIGAAVTVYESGTGMPVNASLDECLCLFGSAILNSFLKQRKNATAIKQLSDDLSRAERKFHTAQSSGLDLLGTSQNIAEIRCTLEKTAASDASILITGETGTGKSYLAQKIHESSGRTGRFMEINCAAIPSTLLESELFGHVKGAFSGAHTESPGLFRAACGGTVFLDEIGEMPPQLQTALLHVLQEHKVRPVGSATVYPLDVRIIAATNKNLHQAMESGEFRADLYHRLALINIHILPLRERPEDLSILTTYFFNQARQKHKRAALRLSREASRILQTYAYPGNVRELATILERAVMLAPDTCEEICAAELALPNIHPRSKSTNLAEALNQKEKEIILQTFRECGNDMDKCAGELGIHQRTLLRKMEKHALVPCRAGR